MEALRFRASGVACFFSLAVRRDFGLAGALWGMVFLGDSARTPAEGFAGAPFAVVRDSRRRLAIVRHGLRTAGAGSHLQDHLLLVAQIHRREMGVLLAPLVDVGLVALITRQKLVVAEVGENVGALLGHEHHPRVFRIGEIDFGYLLGQVLAGAVEIADQSSVDRHAGFARRERIARIDARDYGKGVVVLAHGRGRHGQEDAVGVDQPDLLAVTHESDRRALHDRDAQLIGQNAHHRGLLDPGNLFQLPAAIVQRHEEDIAAHVFAEHGQDVSAGDLPEAIGLNIPGSRNAKPRVAFEVGFEHEAGSDHDSCDGESAASEEDPCPTWSPDATTGRGGAPPGVCGANRQTPRHRRRAWGMLSGKPGFRLERATCCPRRTRVSADASSSQGRRRFFGLR